MKYQIRSAQWVPIWSQYKPISKMSGADNNNYGAVVTDQLNESKIPRQRFDIAEPNTPLQNPIRASIHCCHKGRGS